MEYLKVFADFLEVIDPLNDSERGRLFTAMLEYTQSGKTPELKGNERFIWPIAKQNIDRTALKNEKLRENGCKGGRPSENQSKPNETKENQTEPNKSLYKDKDKDKDKDNTKEKSVKEKAASRFQPPTAEEVRAYCKERGNDVDAEQFIDFYSSKGWKIGPNPMKDWQAAVRTWERRDNYQVKQSGQKPAKQVSAQQYTQRVYTADDLTTASDAIFLEAMQDE